MIVAGAVPKRSRPSRPRLRATALGRARARRVSAGAAFGEADKKAPAAVRRGREGSVLLGEHDGRRHVGRAVNQVRSRARRDGSERAHRAGNNDHSRLRVRPRRGRRGEIVEAVNDKDSRDCSFYTVPVKRLFVLLLLLLAAGAERIGAGRSRCPLRGGRDDHDFVGAATVARCPGHPRGAAGVECRTAHSGLCVTASTGPKSRHPLARNGI